jgi:hypothetical protein
MGANTVWTVKGKKLCTVYREYSAVSSDEAAELATKDGFVIIEDVRYGYHDEAFLMENDDE